MDFERPTPVNDPSKKPAQTYQRHQRMVIDLKNLVAVPYDSSEGAEVSKGDHPAEQTAQERAAQKELASREKSLKRLTETVVSGEMNLLRQEAAELTRKIEHAESEFREHVKRNSGESAGVRPSDHWSREIDRLTTDYYKRYETMATLAEGVRAIRAGNTPDIYFFKLLATRVEGARHWEETTEEHQDVANPLYEMAQNRRIQLEDLLARVGQLIAESYESHTG